MAFGTLSTCLPTYRPLLHAAFRTKKNPKKCPRQDSSGLAKSRHAQFEIGASSLHLFARIEDGHNFKDSETSNIPMNTMLHAEGDVDYDLGPNEIKVITDLEQEIASW